MTTDQFPQIQNEPVIPPPAQPAAAVESAAAPAYHGRNQFAHRPVWKNIVLIIILAGAVASGIATLNYSREIRSKASNNGPVLVINPATKSLPAGQSADLGVTLNSNADTVSAVSLVLSYDPAAVRITGFTPGTILPIVLSPAADANGTYRVTLGVRPEHPFKGAGILGTVSVQAIAAKNSTLLFGDGTAVAALKKPTNALADANGSSIISAAAVTNAAATSTPLPATTTAIPTVPPVVQFSYGNAGDTPVVGNWIGGAVDFPAVIRGSDWHMKKALTGGNADMTVSIGVQTGANTYFLACDWTGAGVKTPAIVSGGTWYLRTSNATGAPDITFSYGLPTDVPVCGNWTGRADGVQTPGIFRNGSWLLRNSNSTGFAEIQYSFGNPGDTPIVGHWTGTKQDFPGVYRSALFYLRNSHTSGSADSVISFGNPGDKPVIGDWTGDGKSDIGVVRGNNWFLKRE